MKRLIIALTSSVAASAAMNGFAWAQATVILPTIEVIDITLGR
jgi:hypothetical protein